MSKEWSRHGELEATKEFRAPVEGCLVRTTRNRHIVPRISGIITFNFEMHKTQPCLAGSSFLSAVDSASGSPTRVLNRFLNTQDSRCDFCSRAGVLLEHQIYTPCALVCMSPFTAVSSFHGAALALSNRPSILLSFETR